MCFDVKAEIAEATLHIDAGVRSGRDVLKALHKTQQTRSIICEQHVRARIKKWLGVRIEEQCIQQHVVRERGCFPILFRYLKREIPGGTRSDLLPQEKLAQHAKRCMPERIACKLRPLGCIGRNFLQPLKSRPIGREIMLEPDPAARPIPAQGASDGEIVKNGFPIH